MKIYKRTIQYVSSMMVLSAIFLIFDYWSIKSSGSNEKIDLALVIAGGVAFGWLAVQILFIDNKKIKKIGGLSFFTWIKYTLQSSAIFLLLIFLIKWLSK